MQLTPEDDGQEGNRMDWCDVSFQQYSSAQLLPAQREKVHVGIPRGARQRQGHVSTENAAIWESWREEQYWHEL